MRLDEAPLVLQRLAAELPKQWQKPVVTLALMVAQHEAGYPDEVFYDMFWPDRASAGPTDEGFELVACVLESVLEEFDA